VLLTCEREGPPAHIFGADHSAPTRAIWEQSGRVGCRAASSRESWKAIIGPHAQGRVSAAPVAATARSPSFFHLRSLSAHHVIELVTAVSSMANMLSQMKMIT
jgi:hypothetical protein